MIAFLVEQFNAAPPRLKLLFFFLILQAIAAANAIAKK